MGAGERDPKGVRKKPSGMGVSERGVLTSDSGSIGSVCTSASAPFECRLHCDDLVAKLSRCLISGTISSDVDVCLSAATLTTFQNNNNMQQLLQPTATRCYIIAYYESTVELQRKTFVVIVQIQA